MFRTQVAKLLFVMSFTSITHTYAMTCEEIAGHYSGTGSNPYSRSAWTIKAVITGNPQQFTIDATINTASWNNPNPRIINKTWQGYCKNERLFLNYEGKEVQGWFKTNSIWIYPEDQIIILDKLN